MPTARYNPSASTVNGEIFVIGGSIDLRHPVLSVVEVYNPFADAWKKQTDMPTPRDLLATSVYDDKIFAIGGQNQGMKSEVEVLSPESPQSVSPQGKLPTTWGEQKAADAN